ncbi:MAG: hypothetical protein QOG33_1441 [Gaiellales bacterium]|jgi:hypothetical protein|nr:hypothetical protein [Gaiellales bacterium]
MEPSSDEARMTGQNGPPGLRALIDKEQMAHKLRLRVGDVVAHAHQKGFPAPVAYFRGRTLWDEASVDSWLREQPGGRRRDR